MASLLRYIFAVCLILSVTVPLPAQDISVQSTLRDTLQKEIELINRQLSDNRQKQKNSLNTLSLIQQKIQRRKVLISDMDIKLDNYKQSIASKNHSIKKLNVRLDTLTAYYQALIYSAYKNRDTRVWFMYLLSSENVSQAVRRWSYLKNISGMVRNQASEITRTRSKLEKERNDLKVLIKASDHQQETRKKEFNELYQEEQALNQSITSLSKQEKTIRKQLLEKKKEVERLNREIERIIAESVKEDTHKAEAPQEKPEPDWSLSFAEAKGRLPFPVVDGIIVEPYGQSVHPVFKDVKLPFNNGINISVPTDSPAKSVFDGKVKQIIVIPGYNQCVLVQHGQYYTFYCKLRKSSVKAGQRIAAGDEIGIIETSQDGTTILHFELWDGIAKQDPQLWLKH